MVRDREANAHGSVSSRPATTAHRRAIYQLLMARGLRDFGDGFVAVLLPAYLTALGFSPVAVGVLASAALLGSALLTLAVGLLGARYDPRQLLLAAAALMIASGFAFAVIDDFAVLLIVAFAGTINPSAGSVSVFVPLEHAVLTREAATVERTKMFARYSLIGALAAAAGALAAAAPDLLSAIGLDPVTTLKAMFVLYAGLGLVGGLIYARIPSRTTAPTEGATVGLGPSRHVVLKLAALFSLDAFAGGFVVQSLLALWLFEKFELSLAAAGVFFFWSGVLSAFSFPVAAWLSRHIGLVNTMVFTHIPSSLCLMLAAIAPTLSIALAFLLLRAALSQMDVPTRSSYVMALVTEAGAGGGCKLHFGAAQPRRGREPGARRRAVFCLVPGGSTHHLRRLEDHLRPAAPSSVPARQAAGRAMRARTQVVGQKAMLQHNRWRSPIYAGACWARHQSGRLPRLCCSPLNAACRNRPSRVIAVYSIAAESSDTLDGDKKRGLLLIE